MTMTKDEAVRVRPYKDDGRADIKSVRRDFEHWYVGNSFDLAADPIGSRKCDLQWRAWLAATPAIAALSQQADTADKWLPIESAPRDGTRIRLKWRNAEDVGSWSLFDESNKEWVWEQYPELRGIDGEWSTDFGNAAADEVEPLGWQPLPAPPAQAVTAKPVRVTREALHRAHTVALYGNSMAGDRNPADLMLAALQSLGINVEVDGG